MNRDINLLYELFKAHKFFKRNFYTYRFLHRGKYTVQTYRSSTVLKYQKSAFFSFLGSRQLQNLKLNKGKKAFFYRTYPFSAAIVLLSIVIWYFILINTEKSE